MRHLLCLVVSGCAIGAPPGFSNGTSWSFPLVDPLDDGRLVTPVYVDGRGPYLFALDPDAAMSMVDRTIAGAAGVPLKPGPRVDDWNDVSHPTFYAEIPNIRIGDLEVSLRPVAVTDDHTFDADGRVIDGIIGRDIIADSVVFAFDRERGIASLTTEDAFVAPAGAQVLSYFKGNPEVVPWAVIHKLVTVNIDGHTYDMHLDLSHSSNQLRERHWSEAGLNTKPMPAEVIDSTGTRHDAGMVGVAPHVAAGPISHDEVSFIPFLDRRWWWGQGELEGTLGLDFFRAFSIAADWQHERLYVTPRVTGDAVRVLRFARWGRITQGCPHAGCVAVSIGHAVPTFTAVRDPEASGRDLEIVIGAALPSGQQLPHVRIELPRGAGRVSAPIDARYATATLTVLDVSPFPRACRDIGGCIDIAP